MALTISGSGSISGAGIFEKNAPVIGPDNASMNYSGGQWTVYQNGHTYVVGNVVTIAGAETGDFFDANGTYTIDFVDTNTWSSASLRAGIGSTPFFFASNWGQFNVSP